MRGSSLTRTIGLRIRHRSGDRNHIFRAGAPGDLWWDISDIQGDFLVIKRALIAGQRLPIGHSFFPGLSLGRHFAAFQVGECRLIRRNQTSACTAFNCHVTDSHTPFHGQIADRLTGKFNDMAGPARRANLANDRQDQILCRNTSGQCAIDCDTHILCRVLLQRLGRQNMLNFRRSNTKRQRAKRAMGRGVTVAANNRHARQGEALFRSDDMNDALANIAHFKNRHAEFFRIGRQGFDLDAAFLILDPAGAVCGRHIVIRHSQGKLWTPHFATGNTQTFKSLRAGHFMHQMAVDINQAGTIILSIDNVAIPDFIKQRSWLRHAFLTPFLPRFAQGQRITPQHQF